MKIRLKLLIAFGSILLLSIVMVFVAKNAIDNILKYKSLNEAIDRLDTRLVELSLSARDFIHSGYKSTTFQEEGTGPSLEGFAASREAIQEILLRLEGQEAFANPQAQRAFGLVKTELAAYADHFTNLVGVLKTRGFKDHGAEGALRHAIHEVENSDADFDMAQMLMLRRHEKDFFLRKDPRYLSKFNDTVDDFYQSVARRPSAGDPSQRTGELLDYIAAYKEKFNHIVVLEKEIGLTAHQGLKGQMAAALASLQPRIAQLGMEVKATSQRLIDQSMGVLFGIFIIQLIVGVLLVLFYSGLLSKSIKEIKNAMVSLADGHFPKKLKVKSNDEIGQTKKSLNGLIDRVRTAVDFATNLGNGELRQQYHAQFSNDVLAKSIMAMQQKLIAAETQQGKINWHNQGMAMFTEILKDDSLSLGLLGDKIIKALVKYIDTNQGAIYLWDEEGGLANRLSTYAYGRKKFEAHEVEPGEGMVGQCIIEKETTYMTKIPDGYTKITSGLGHATPSSVLVVPLKAQDTLIGVVELASFELMEKHQIDFVEKAAENIANILCNKQIAVRTQQLLEESQEKAEILAAQEEEMRQNTEELQATQEDMNRQKEELEAKILLLKSDIKNKDNRIQYLEAQTENLGILQKIENQIKRSNKVG